MAILWFLLGIVIGAGVVWYAKSGDVRAANTRLADSEARIGEYRDALRAERAQSARLIDDNNRQWQIRLDAVKNELMRSSAEALNTRQADLQEANRQQISDLLRPIREKFAEFQRTVEATRTQGEVNKNSIQSTFEATLRLFNQQQQQAVDRMLDATTRIGREADNLTKALKSDTKKQGNWGELVLETLLENCGLRRDEEYFVQKEYKDSRGVSAYPDVVVRFPEGRCVVIDSKVSLTDYANSVATDDDAERERLLREHVRSVRKHIDELVKRDYSSIVDEAIGFVLMFVPNESAYIAAIKQQPDLTREAYSKRIIIISPSNLLMALQLAYNLWQYDRQGKNIDKIIATAADLYDKVVGFEETFVEIDTRINQLRTAFDRARNRLYDGRGSVIDRVNSLRTMGVTPKKRLRNADDRNAEIQKYRGQMEEMRRADTEDAKNQNSDDIG